MMQFRIIGSILYLLLTGYAFQAQEMVTAGLNAVSGSQNIIWVNQFPPKEAVNQLKFSEKLVSAIFGKNNMLLLTKPVAVLAMDTGNYWIVDQGNGILF